MIDFRNAIISVNEGEQMAKRPAYQWYPGDARRDTALQSCSLCARGLWREMMDLMHDGEPYGHLTAGGVLITLESLARLVGEPAAKVRVWFAELDDRKVFSRTTDGVVFSRRMVKDEELRALRAAAGSKSAGNPNVPRAKGGKDRVEDILPDTLTTHPSGGPLQFAVAVAKKKQRTTSGKPGWVVRFGEAWIERFGGTAHHGRIGKAIKPLLDSHSVDDVLAAWIRYLDGKPPEFASPQDFASKFGLYSGSVGSQNVPRDADQEFIDHMTKELDASYEAGLIG